MQRDKIYEAAKDKIYEVASDLYFYFIDHLNIRDKCVMEVDDYTENTDLGREIYYMIEDTLIKNFFKPNKKIEWSLLGNADISKLIKAYIKAHNKRIH